MLRTQYTVPVLAACLLLGPLACSAANEKGEDEAVASAGLSLRLPPLPSPTLAVPAGNRLKFYADAIGVQIYACEATATGFAWTFRAPEASLLDRRGRVVIDHYAGPTWEWVADGSKVVAARVAGFTDDPSAIPELLLQATSHENAGRLSQVTYIQRLETTGGLAPSAGCDAEHIGVTVRVDYTATYFFYEAKSARCD
jgi:hypothetical protein